MILQLDFSDWRTDRCPIGPELGCLDIVRRTEQQSWKQAEQVGTSVPYLFNFDTVRMH